VKNLLCFFKDMKFRQKLMISYIIISIIPIAILGFFSYHKSKTYMYHQIEDSMKSNLEQVSLSISNKMERQQKFINYLSLDANLRDVLMNDSVNLYLLSYTIRQTLEPMITNYLIINSPEIVELCIYSDFRQKWLGSYIKPSKEVREEEWYKKTAESFNTEWWFTQDRIFATHSIRSNYANKFIGMLLVFFNQDEIFSDIEQIGAHEYYLEIRNDNGEKVFLRNKLQSRHITGEIELESFIDSKEFLHIQSRINRTGWIINLLIPKDAIAVDTGVIIEATGMIILACIVVLIFLIWLLSNTFVKRIYALTKKIEIIEQGNLDIEISSSCKDEIGNLTNSFGRMLVRVNSLMREIYQSKLNEKESHLKLLQAQINPHFLYNSLSIINWKAINIDSLEISEITTLLSKFYRTTLNKGRSITTVRDEIENIKAYVTLQLIMHNNSFDVVYDFSDEIFKYKIINFVLQPIVENAIMHGIDKKENGRGVLTIAGYAYDGNIEFVIKDNGPGIKQEIIDDLFQLKTSGYGLRNVNERIKLFYGAGYGITAETNQTVGTTMKVKLPQHINDRNSI